MEILQCQYSCQNHDRVPEESPLVIQINLNRLPSVATGMLSALARNSMVPTSRFAISMPLIAKSNGSIGNF